MRRLFLFAVTLLFLPSLHAQAVEIYGTLSDLHTSSVPYNVTVCSIGCGTINDSSGINNFSPGGGVTLNFLQLPVVKLGVDARGSHHTGTDGADTALGGIKLTIKPPGFRASPYIQGSFGYLGTTNRGTTAHYAATEVLGGIDLPILAVLDLRAIEVGVGHALNSVDANKPTFVTVGAGLVFHF